MSSPPKDTPEVLTLSCWNARGYLAAIPYLRHLLKRNQILAVSEHWLHQNRLTILDEISDSHHVFSRASNHSPSEKFGTHRGQGGVAIFWHKDLAGVSTIANLRHDRMCAIRVQPKSGHTLIIVSVYLPAMGGQDDLAVCLDELSELILSLGEDSHYFIAGDFNADIGFEGGPRGLHGPTERGQLLLRFMERHNFIASNMQNYATGPVSTHYGPNSESTLDYILVPYEIADNVTACSVKNEHPLNTSDHSVVSVRLRKSGLSKVTVHEPKSERVKWSKLGTEGINTHFRDAVATSLAEISALLSTSPCEPEVIDSSFSAITDTLLNASKRLPHTSYRKHIKPFWNQHLGQLKRIKVDAYRRWVLAGRPRGYDFREFSEYKRTKVEFSKALRRYRRNFEN